MAFLAARPMEDFFINPILDMDTASSTATPDDFGLYDAFPQHKRAPAKYSSGKSTPRSTTMPALSQSAASSQTLPQEQPDYFYDYASDEEIASPADADDSDDYSYHSSEEGTESVGGAITPGSYVAEAVHQCSRAQAVRIQPVGKPRVINLPKLDLSYRRTSQPSSSFTQGRRGSRLTAIEESRMSRSSQESHSRNDSMDSSTANSPASTAPSSVDEEELSQLYTHQKNKGSLRHVPLMEAAKAMTPTEDCEIPRSATFPRLSIDPVNRHSTDLADRFNTPASPAGSFRPTIRKMGKFSSIINLNRHHRDCKEAKENSETSSMYSTKGFEAQSVSRQVSQGSVPARRSSTQQRLVARGANERAPTMTLPPFPGD